MTTAQAAVETVETANTAAAVETNSAVNETPIPTELDALNELFANPKATSREFETFADMGLLDGNLVRDLVDLSGKFVAHSNPDSRKAEIDELKKSAAELLKKTNATEETLSVMLKIQELESQQKNEGVNIREKLVGVPFKSVLLAYADEYVELVEFEIVNFIRQHRNSKMKHAGRSKSGAATTVKTVKKAGPSVVVEYKGEKIEIAKGKGPLPKKLAEVIAAFAKETKVEKVDKSTFITALEANKVKGVKFIESKAGDI